MWKLETIVFFSDLFLGTVLEKEDDASNKYHSETDVYSMNMTQNRSQVYR